MERTEKVNYFSFTGEERCDILITFHKRAKSQRGTIVLPQLFAVSFFFRYGSVPFCLCSMVLLIIPVIQDRLPAVIRSITFSSSSENSQCPNILRFSSICSGLDAPIRTLVIFASFKTQLSAI